MSVMTLGVSQNYTGDGNQSAFVYPNYVLEQDALIVIISVGLPLVSTYLGLNAQPGFSFAGITDEYGSYPTGGVVQIVDANGNPVAPAAGASIDITRNTPKIQPISLIDNQAFPATVIEHSLDRLTCIVQEIAGGLGNYLGELPGPPTYGNVCDWFTVCPPVPGGPWGYVCVAENPDGTANWCVIADISF